jgi:hypothetical protein
LNAAKTLGTENATTRTLKSTSTIGGTSYPSAEAAGATSLTKI